MAVTKAAVPVSVGENVSYSVNGSKLTITVDLAHRATNEPLPGKKTIRVASTLGNAVIGGYTDESGQEVRLGLNAYVYPPR